jgi:hypothetical protein
MPLPSAVTSLSFRGFEAAISGLGSSTLLLVHLGPPGTSSVPSPSFTRDILPERRSTVKSYRRIGLVSVLLSVTLWYDHAPGPNLIAITVPERQIQ